QSKGWISRSRRRSVRNNRRTDTGAAGATGGTKVQETAVDPADFREAMSQFASGVTVVTTRDSEGRPWGFTASAFSSLSLDPPLLLVCLQRDAESFAAFEEADSMSVSILAEGQGDIA